MRSLIVSAAALMMVMSSSAVPAAGKQSIADQVKSGCKTELDTFCKDVSPGEGRLLACLYAFESKVSPSCEYALYDASLQLERAAAAFAHGVNECHADLVKHCKDVQPGEGRLADCLQKHKDKLSKRCRQGLKDIGLES